MSRVKGTGTSAERTVGDAFRRAGLRFSQHARTLPGCPDFVFRRARLAVFVNGCFWHWHGCPRCRLPKSNTDYWRGKIDRNVARDKRTRSELRRLRWRYTTIWECDLKRGIARAIRRARQPAPVA